MSDLLKALERLTNEQLIYALIGGWAVFILIVVYFRFPDLVRATLRRAKQIESNQRILVENDKEIASLIVEFARRCNVNLSEPNIQDIKIYEEDL